jgi:hypothetical protein
MKLNFKNKSKLIKDPFTIFEIKDYLKQDDFNDLYKSFPDQKYFDKKENGITKDTFSSSNDKFPEFLKNNPKWEKFYNSVNSEAFIKSAYKESLIPNIKSRGISALKIWSLNQKKNLFKIFFRKVSVRFIFSRIYKSKKIMPHTDATGKLMSIIYYFADINWSKEKGGNTLFWKTLDKWNNWDNKHVTEENFGVFSKENRTIHESIFEPNKLICFFKSKSSWHSVEEINLKENESRKVLNIFVRY